MSSRTAGRPAETGQPGRGDLSQWRDRVVERGHVDPRELRANPRNWRLHPDEQRRPLRASLSTVGWVTYGALINRRLVENGWEVEESGDYLVDGHARVEEAIDAAQRAVPYTTVALTPAEEAQVLATLDPIAALATGDADVFAELIAEAGQAHPDLEQLMVTTRDGLRALAELAEQDGGAGGRDTSVDGARDEADQDDAVAFDYDGQRAELRAKWGTEPGQLWVVPSRALHNRAHRIVCGDCTDEAVFRRATGGLRADLTPTDPPYNIDLKYGDAFSDDLEPEEYARWTQRWVDRWLPGTSRMIVTPGGHMLGQWHRLFERSIYHTAPWVKTNATTPGKVAHFWCWEPLLFFGVKGFGDARANDVFAYPIGRQFAEGLGAIPHRCPKPMRLWLELIEHYSGLGDVLHDPFLGSGTTLIAAERLGRIALGCDVDPASVAVCLERAVGIGLRPRLAEPDAT